MKRDNESARVNHGSVGISKNKGLALSLFIVLTVALLLQGCSQKSVNQIPFATQKVSDLFEVEEQEGMASKIKDSTDQEQINEAAEAVDQIDTTSEEQGVNEFIVFGLQSAILNAQMQLNEREGTPPSSANVEQEEQSGMDFQPEEEDIVFEKNELKNKDTLETFMQTAGENGENNESEIRVVKDEGAQGVLIYDLKSRYDKNADQRWIEVTPDLSHYSPAEDEVQDVFHTSQQCGYLSKDEAEGYYKVRLGSDGVLTPTEP